MWSNQVQTVYDAEQPFTSHALGKGTYGMPASAPNW